MAPIPSTCFSQTHCFPNLLIFWLWFLSLYLNCSCSIFLSQYHPALLHPNACAPSLSNGLAFTLCQICSYRCPSVHWARGHQQLVLWRFWPPGLAEEGSVPEMPPLHPHEVRHTRYFIPQPHLGPGRAVLYVLVYILSCLHFRLPSQYPMVSDSRAATGMWLNRKLSLSYFYNSINHLFLISQLLIILTKVSWFWEWLLFEKDFVVDLFISILEGFFWFYISEKCTSYSITAIRWFDWLAPWEK